MSPDADNCPHYRTARVPDGHECLSCGRIFGGIEPVPRRDGRRVLSKAESAQKVRELRQALRDRRNPPDPLNGIVLDPPHIDEDPWP